MRSFEHCTAKPDEFVERVNQAVREQGHADRLSVRMEDNFLVVRFRWMGLSELRFRVEERPDTGFRAILVSERMSPWHGAFRGAIEDRFDAVLAELGAVPL